LFPELGRLKQKDCYKADAVLAYIVTGLGYRVRLCSKKYQKKKKKTTTTKTKQNKKTPKNKKKKTQKTKNKKTTNQPTKKNQTPKQSIASIQRQFCLCSRHDL
jgi:hypothetical protein